MKPGDIIYFKANQPLFNWAKGLKILISITDDEACICGIDEFGKPIKYEDGRYMVIRTDNNEQLLPTKLSYKLEDNPKYL